MAGDEHECVKDESFREMTKEFKGLSVTVNNLGINMALIQRDVTDLKQVTVVMSECIKALTETSIKAGENNITRDQFYAKIDELNTKRTEELNDVINELDKYIEKTDTRIDDINLAITTIKGVCDDYAGLKKLVYGIIVSIALFLIFEGYRLLVHVA